jgi:hypothetical protein
MAVRGLLMIAVILQMDLVWKKKRRRTQRLADLELTILFLQLKLVDGKTHLREILVRF